MFTHKRTEDVFVRAPSRCLPFLSGLFALVAGGGAVALMFWERYRFYGAGKFIHGRWLLPLLFWLPLLMLQRRITHKHRDTLMPEPERRKLDPALPMLLAMLLLTLITSIPRHPWFFLFNWSPTDLYGSWMIRFVLLSSLLFPFMLAKRSLAPWLLGFLLLAQAACIHTFLDTTGGLPLYRDDHPAFLFRLHEFIRVFPKRINYNPWWNAGVIDSVGTSSGITAPGLALWPLWKLFPIHEIYTPALAILFIAIPPWLAVLALRSLRAGWTAAACAGILALGASRYYFVWALHFGTIGSAFSVTFLIPLLTLAYRLFVLRRRDWLTCAGLGVCAFMLAQWPPGILMASPLVISLAAVHRRWKWKTWGAAALCAAALSLLLLPKLLTLLNGKDLLSFTLDSPGDVSPVSTHATLLNYGLVFRRTLGVRLLEINPLIVFFGIVGAGFLPWKHARRWFLPVIVLLTLTAAWGQILLPNLQLERMAIPLALTAVVPAACWMGRLLEDNRPSLALARSASLALLVMGAYTVHQVYKNKGYAPYAVMPPLVTQTSDWIKANVPEDGRVLYVGSTVHFYGHGHVAYLPVLTEREMMACDYYHFPMTMVEYEYPPRAFRDSPESLERFMRLHGVTHIFAFRNYWVEALRAHPDLFVEHQDFQEDGFYIFERREPASRFIQGAGSVHADFDRIVVEFADDAAEAVVAYNWSDRFETDGPAQLFPYDAGDGLTFIGIRPNGTKKAILRFRSRL